ncbi:hypothetical protein FA15DRAFT_704655 [Coprinopsis marcescibilis]|uniref:Uncharacterized protein n=1 Tax=Coprinopsis marcescibilis TaxID=230819 RepID=A0A5C3KUK5_COPMA|nr:hypothetical protein FA15DRAFT_704655 [Coprinopsis marcescibilis]
MESQRGTPHRCSPFKRSTHIVFRPQLHSSARRTSPHQIRKDSGPSPYPQARDCQQLPVPQLCSETQASAAATPALQQRRCDANTPSLNVAPSLDTIKPLSPLTFNLPSPAKSLKKDRKDKENKPSTGPVVASLWESRSPVLAPNHLPRSRTLLPND